eukprot:1078829-Pyramimonas_sp.AAC.1
MVSPWKARRSHAKIQWTALGPQGWTSCGRVLVGWLPLHGVKDGVQYSPVSVLYSMACSYVCCTVWCTAQSSYAARGILPPGPSLRPGGSPRDHSR